MAKRVLIVDDEPEICEILSEYLGREGFGTVVQTNVKDAIAELGRGLPDMMLLDVTLPDGSGLDVLRAIGDRRVPTIMLTARADELDRIVGLELGADDYVAKPFSPREVVARVRAVMRRTQESENPVPKSAARDVLTIDDLEIDFDEHEVRVAGKPAHLTPSEFRLLAVLAKNPGHAFSRSQLLDHLRDDGSIFERTLDRHINNLRKKIEPNPSEPAYVQTVYGVGYRMKKLHP